MELSKECLVNAAIGHWYPHGQKRLIDSLNNVGFMGDKMFFCNEKINNYYQEDCVYTIKAAALHEASKKYNILLWVDCAYFAIKNPSLIFNIIKKNGCFFSKSGYNLAQSANDYSLNYAGITRDEATSIPEVATGCFGIDLRTVKGKKFLDLFLKYSVDKVFHGSRLHDNQSTDKRFLFHRQDQTAATIAFHKLGFEEIYECGLYTEYDVYYDNTKQKNIVLLNRGM